MSQSLTSQSLLDRFDVSTDDLALLKECGDVLGNKIMPLLAELNK